MRVNRHIVERLFEIVEPIDDEKISAKANPFRDKTIVLTGTMSMSRSVIKNQLEKLGAKVSSSVSKKSDYLIYGDDAGSKLTKAQKLEVVTITEEQMREMVQL
jgi:DNA ligase (NAD+)